MRITSGAVRMCALFDADTIKRDLPGSLVAKGAVSTSLPDCEDATRP